MPHIDYRNNMEPGSKEKDDQDWLETHLTELQKHFLNLLLELGVEGDALAGTFLLMKDDIEGMEEMLVWMYDFHPSREEIDKELIRRVVARNNDDK